ncbi:alginate lyase family protein [Cerasicoccus arenae]|uniref:Heparinase n=1 Tax=Cerasicoccus arenae TaxID=424488 RepID=A0A8J3DGS6_9BACT|nr:alginate lyase family protein [Cerasicoccus arenae]MBK1859526.1 alginate lyase family protein [Cerasicoccus arenae]GHB97144.1 heparinase [Cerasicoccus arenae]
MRGVLRSCGLICGLFSLLVPLACWAEAVAGKTDVGQPAEPIVDNPDTFWDERLMPLIAPIIEQANAWAPVENINWNGIALPPEEPLRPPGTKLDIEPERLRKLMDQLNLDHPGLEQVREYYQQDDLDQAGLALVEYYRARKWADVFYDSQPANHLDYIIVEMAMIDIFTQGQVFGRQPRRADGLLDWKNGGPRDDPEWAWWINRMGYLQAATALWEATGGRRYAQFVNDHLADWVRANPYPAVRSFSAQWRPLEVARRIDKSWLDAIIRLSDSPDFTPESRLLMLSSIPDHADAMLNYPSFSGNHLLTEKVMLAELAIAFPEFKDAPIWLEDAVQTVVGLMAKQVYPDGAYEELTNHYQLVALGSFQRFLELLESGDQTELIDSVKPTVESMWNYFAYVMRPDGMGPLNNDSDLQNNRAELAQSVPWFDRPDWVYLATAGAEGTEPAGPPSRFFPYAGHAIMRDGWDEQAQWAFFDIGPYGSDHQHNDRLHLSVSFGGKDFLVDSGRYDYTPGTTRDYFKGPHGHNVVLLDDQAPLSGPKKVSAPMPVTAEITSAKDIFAASVKFPARPLLGQGPRMHKRRVEYRRGIGWIVTDEVIAFGPTEVSVRWLFAPDREVEKTTDGLRTVDPEGANLRMALMSDKDWDVQLYCGQGEPVEAGWQSTRFTTRQPATQAIYKTMISGPTTFTWIIAPSDANWSKLSAGTVAQ